MPIKLHRDQFRWTNGRGHNQKPILYSQKTNTYGLGKKEHESDQWWTKAFDSQLRSLDVSSGTNGGVTVQQNTSAGPSALAMAAAMKSKYYVHFVFGGVLAGNVEKSATATPVSTDDESGKEKGEKKQKEGKTSRNKKIAKTKKEEMGKEKKEKKRLKRMVEKEMARLKGETKA